MNKPESLLIARTVTAVTFLAMVLAANPLTADPAAEVQSGPPNGVIEASAPEFRVDLQGISGRVTLASMNGKITLPQGDYILMRWTLPRRDKQGRLWEATFAPARYQWFKLRSEPHRLDLTGDLTAITTAEPGPTHTALTLRYEGDSGQLQALTVNGAHPAEPKLKIVAGKKTIAQVDSHYACCFTSRASWPTPRELRGSFEVLPVADLGPFPIKTVRPAQFKITDATFARPGFATAKVGQEAPDFSLARIGGSTNLRPFWLRGRPLILLFSCGCVPCEEAARGLTSSDLARQAESAIVVTNEHAATTEAAKQFRERSGYKGPMVADDGKVGPAYAAEHCPKLWLLDTVGIARWTGGGQGDKRNPGELLSELQKTLSSLHRAPGATAARP
jgi:peroxiredoxin